MSVPKQILLSILVVLLAAGGWYAFTYRGDFPAGAPTTATGDSPSGGAGAQNGGERVRGGSVPVVTATVGTDDLGPQIRAIGTVAAAKAITLFPEITGIVRSVEVEPGAEVSEGQVLVRLNDDDQRIAIDRAGIALDDAQAALDRAERLAQTNNVTEVALSDARTAVRSAEIDLKSAQIELDRRNIVAPFAGVVGLISVDDGDLVNTSAALTTLDDLSRFTVTFSATERFADLVKIGHPVTGTTIGLPGREIKGAVSAVDSRVDPATRVFEVEATLEEGIEGVKPGMSIMIAVDFAGEPQMTVPSLAVQWDRQGSFVWTLDGDTAKRTPVQILGRRSGIVVVAGDLRPDVEVVVEGLQRMREGVAVDRVGGEPSAAADPEEVSSGSNSGPGARRIDMAHGSGQ
jgi:RND family efflux transporter MFP subunit